jgi:hypothetical protein
MYPANEVARLKREIDRFLEKTKDISSLDRFLWAGKLFMHPDICLWFHRDFKWWGFRKLVKHNESKGILCLRFGWFVATVRC